MSVQASLAYSIPLLLLLLLHFDGASSGGAGWQDPGYGGAGWQEPGYGGAGWHDPGYGGSSYYGHDQGYGRHGGRVVTRVTYEEQPPVVERQQVHVTHEVHHVLHKKKRRKQLVAVVPAEPVAVVAAGPNVVGLNHRPNGFEGSYVAVSGTPGRGSVHVVESVPALGRDSVYVVNGKRVHSSPGLVPSVQLVPPPVVHPSVVGQPRGTTAVGQIPLPATRLNPDGVAGDRLPLPKCVYINTDLPGNDLNCDNKNINRNNEEDIKCRSGVNAGSARACKALCRQEEDCSFWTYREGFNRDITAKDCFLKEGTPGLPVPKEAVPRIGFVSGTKDNNCVCIKSDDEEDEVCPIKDPKGRVYPWRSTQQEEEDMARGLLPSGWRRLGGEDPLYPGLLGQDPLYTGGGSLQAEVRGLRAQLDILTDRLANQ